MTNPRQDFSSLVNQAVDFHGHLGPFLVIGLRIGLIGLRELNTTRGDPKLQIVTILKHAVPFSCAIDGVQVITQCTLGNGKLKLKNKPETITSIFKLRREKQVTVTMKTAKYEELKRSLPKDRSSYRSIQLAREVASMPEEKLFTITKK
jgi:formylmethanofuran dehydrogenase subunit E